MYDVRYEIHIYIYILVNATAFGLADPATRDIGVICQLLHAVILQYPIGYTYKAIRINYKVRFGRRR